MICEFRVQLCTLAVTMNADDIAKLTFIVFYIISGC